MGHGDNLPTAAQLRRECIEANAPGPGHANVHGSGSFDWCRRVVKDRFRELIELAIELNRD